MMSVMSSALLRQGTGQDNSCFMVFCYGEQALKIQKEQVTCSKQHQSSGGFFTFFSSSQLTNYTVRGSYGIWIINHM